MAKKMKTEKTSGANDSFWSLTSSYHTDYFPTFSSLKNYVRKDPLGHKLKWDFSSTKEYGVVTSTTVSYNPRNGKKEKYVSLLTFKRHYFTHE